MVGAAARTCMCTRTAWWWRQRLELAGGHVHMHLAWHAARCRRWHPTGRLVRWRSGGGRAAAGIRGNTACKRDDPRVTCLTA